MQNLYYWTNAQTLVIQVGSLPSLAQQQLLDFYLRLWEHYNVEKKQKQAFFQSAQSYRFALPISYQFNRDELYER